VGEKKKIGERSEPRGRLERERGGVAWRHLPKPIFFQFDHVFCLFIPTAEPHPTAHPKLVWCLIMEFSFRAGPIVNRTVIKEILRFISELF